MIDHVVLLSLEPWDDTWRRNQHLASRLVTSGRVGKLTFVEPPERFRLPSAQIPPPAIRLLTPKLSVPRRLGGLSVVAASLMPVLASASLVWVNDPRLGAACRRAKAPFVYDVTDDWRAYPFPPRIIRRLIWAEDRLADRATTVVCSDTLAERWRQRYSVDPAVIRNGVDITAHETTRLIDLAGQGPHVGYVGTLQSERLDVDLVLRLSNDPAVGTVHLIGPDALDPTSRARLDQAAHVIIHRPVPSSEVPGWMAAMDVLVAPHHKNAFTLSLDAIKAYEYVASRRPVVATSTSGFQHMSSTGVLLGEGDAFLSQLRRALTSPEEHRTTPLPGSGWDDRSKAFAQLLQLAAAQGARAG